MTVTHRLPEPDQATTPCCGLTLFELPPLDRITSMDALVTCQVREADQ